MTQALHIHLAKQLDRFEMSCDLILNSEGLTGIYGPSGSGKTTLLRCISGLERASGKVSLDNTVWQDGAHFVAPECRSIGYVFQDGRLFPHLNVRENIAYGFKRTRLNDRQISLEQVTDWLGLGDLLDRNIHKLSGGEKQRVSIARALATSPRLLLMDEPLSALDIASKQSIMPYLETLHQSLSIPVLYVSHALDEITRLADHLVLIESGKVVASGSLNAVLTRADQSIHHTEETAVVVQAEITERDSEWGLLKATFVDGHLWLKDQGEPLGKTVRLRLLARDISLSLEQNSDQSILNTLQGRIDAIVETNHPATKLVRVEIGNNMLLARVTSKSLALLKIEIGQKIWVQIKSVAVLD